MKILKISMIILFVISCLCCKNNNSKKSTDIESISEQIKESDTLLIQKIEKYSFDYDNSNFQSFGIEFYNHDLPVGPCDILLLDSSMIIIDSYHNNLKKLSFSGQIKKASAPLSNKRNWLKQLAKINNRIFVTSELDSLYIYNFEFELIERKYIKTKNGRIFNVTEDQIVLYCPLLKHKFIEIDYQGNIINEIIGIEHKRDYNSTKEYFENGIKKNNSFYMSDSIDLRNYIFDINDNKVTYFNIDSSQFIVNILYY